MRRVRAPHAREFSFVCVGLALATMLACAAQAKVTRLTPGTYQVECKDSLALCLVPAQELCRAYGYDVVSGTERRNYVGQHPEGYEAVSASATVRCRQAVPMFGRDPNEPVPPLASAAASSAPAALPTASTAPPAVPTASVAPVPSAPAAPSSPPAGAVPSVDGGAP